MIELADATQPPQQSHWQQPGGFCWWYAEAGDDAGNGIVLIWAFGLPFLPGHANAVRRGVGTLPTERPSLNVVVHRAGQLAFYVLREVREATWDGEGRWRFDDTHIESVQENGKLALRVTLDVPVVGEAEPLTGSLVLAGRVAQTAGHALGFGASPHQWTPQVGPSFASAAVQCGGFRWRLAGRGYHDRNASPLPLHALQIQTWLWARAALPDRDRIVYALWPKDGSPVQVHGLDVLEDGRVAIAEALDLTTAGATTTRYGMPTWRQLTVRRAGMPWLDLRLDRRVDDGPFYLRFLPGATTPDGPVVAASAEIIVPDRIDLARHRPFVRMRVSGPGPRASAWLPLFEGAAQTRARRLWRRWLPAVLRGDESMRAELDPRPPRER